MNIPVYRDGDIAEEYMPKAPTPTEIALEKLHSTLHKLNAQAKLEARMIAYDVFHGTHYHRIHRDLMRKKREDEHIDRIGLVRLYREVSMN